VNIDTQGWHAKKYDIEMLTMVNAFNIINTAYEERLYGIHFPSKRGAEMVLACETSAFKIVGV